MSGQAIARTNPNPNKTVDSGDSKDSKKTADSGESKDSKKTKDSWGIDDHAASPYHQQHHHKHHHKHIKGADSSDHV